MTKLSVNLLGPPIILRDDQPVEFETRKAIALLAYLALERKMYRRSSLATMLWPDSDRKRGRTALRRTLTALNKGIGRGWIEATRTTITLQPQPDLFVDVHHFRALIEEYAEDDDSADSGDCSRRLPQLNETVELYRGEFLEGFTLVDSPEFDEWQLYESDHCRRQHIRVLLALATCHAQLANYEQAVDVMERVVTLDPLNELAHQKLMTIHAGAGRRSAAIKQYEECERILYEELGVEPQADTVELYGRILQGKLELAQPMGDIAGVSPAAQPFHVTPPRQTKPLTDRREEIGRLQMILDNENCQLVTLIGTGGIGKTRLALEIAEQREKQYEHGAAFVDLAAVSSPSYLVSTIADALDFSFYGAVGRDEDLRAELIDFLREKELLLVLDNFEHVLEGADLVTEIIQAAPAVKIIVTSQERLHVAEEWLMDLKGLSFPTNGDIETARYDAVTLFARLAQRVNPGFELSEKEAPYVARICRLVGGLPLGIELASSWTRVLSTREIAQEIEKDLDFLSGLSTRNIPERHRSLRAVFEYTWRLLAGEERDALRNLTVFHGGFRATAATFVAGASISLLLALADKSLLQRVSEKRFAIPDVLRQYARQKFEADLEPEVRDEVFSRHCKYYCVALGEREPELLSDLQAEVLSDISIDLENVRQAWEWAIGHRDIESLDRSMETVYRYYQTRSLFHEGEQLFRKIVAMCREHDIEGLSFGRALSRQGRLLLRMSRLAASKPILEESAAVLERFDAPRELASTLSVLAVIADAEGDYDRSVELQERSLKLFNQAGDQKGVAAVHLRMGNIGFATGDYALARMRYQMSHRIYRELGDQRGMAMCLNNLGSIADTLGEYREARRLFRESLAIKWDLGDRRGVAYTLNNLGFVSYLLGEHDLAEAKLTECLAIFREIGDRRGIAYALVNLGNVAFGRGNLLESEANYRESLELCEESGYRLGCAYALNHLGAVSQRLDRPEEARTYLKRALQTATAIHATPVILEILVNTAGLLVQSEDNDLAYAALKLAQEHPSSRYEARQAATDILSEQDMSWEAGGPINLTVEDVIAAVLARL